MEELTMVEAARLTGVAERTIRRAVKAGRLPANLSNPKRAKISSEDLNAWRTATQPVQVTLLERIEELTSELAELKIKVDTHTRAITQLQGQRTTTPTITPPTRPAQPPKQKPATKTTELPAGMILLRDFADRHDVSRNEAQALWQRGNIKGMKIGQGRKARVAIDSQGQRDAWAQFKILPNFVTCDQCPHALKGSGDGNTI